VPETVADRPQRAFVLGDRLFRQRPSCLGATCLVLIAAVIALPLRGLYAATGSSMEEAFMLVFPQQLRDGQVPNVDFLHLYGPGSLDVLVGWYGLFGHSLASERTFGLLQHIGIILAIYAITRAWGHVAATTCAVACTLLVLTPIGLSALAWEGGVALGLWSVVFGLRALHLSARADDGWTRQITRNVVVAAVLAGLALCYRPDLVIALVLAHGWLLWRSRRARKPFVIGLVAGLLPLIIHLFVAGLGPSIRGMVLDPVFHLRPGRELPRPPSWSVIDGALQAVAEGSPPWWRFPALGASHQLFIWFFAMIITAVVVVLVARKTIKRGDRGRGATLMMAGLFGLGIVPQALQRPDSTHLAWVVCVCFSLIPVTLIEVLHWRRPRTTHRVNLISAIVAMGAVFFIVCPFFTYRAYLLQARVSVGNKRYPFEVKYEGREFWMGNAPLADASNKLIADLAKMSKPGERLLVGPADLSRTIYSDVMFYYMFPDLVPATYYIEMDPGLADKPGSSLAADVQSADWLVLTNFWTGWHEPNASSNFGSDAPNQVVAKDFCLVGNYDDALALLYHRCVAGSGISPAEVGERSAKVRAAGG
jgi:hypothetical protein